MAQMIYANPFGAAAEGAQRGLDNVLKLGQAGRDFRNQDINYDFRKWYDPHMRDQYQAKAAADVEAAQMQRLQNLANAGRYVGDLGRFNQEIGGYYGMPPQGTRTPTQGQFAADIYSGAIHPALASPDVVSAGGITRKAPLSPAEQELNALEQQFKTAQINYYKNLYENPPQQYQYGAQPPIDLGVGGGVQTNPQPQYGMPEQVPTNPSAQPRQNEGVFYGPPKPQAQPPVVNIFDETFGMEPYGEF